MVECMCAATLSGCGLHFRHFFLHSLQVTLLLSPKATHGTVGRLSLADPAASL